MKAVKEPEHGLLLNCFGIQDRLYLAVTVMTFFGFEDPGNALKEQQMWPFVQDQLGKDAILDAAMPKPMAEVLLQARCFAPDQSPRAALPVSLRLGPIEKTLNVFGDRFWERSAGVLTISRPQPFTEMALGYDRSFGGEGFAPNPVGKGHAPMVSPAGARVQPLPNIEDPRHLIGAPDDRPAPAGFGPLDPAWPQRAGKLGTYDSRWLAQRWPFYPDDMDWTYFNAAPDDQQADAFFTGDERFVLAHLHKTKPAIESHLPGLRHRVFVKQLEAGEKPDGEALFKEVKTRIDTVWLFPHAERGITISRGTVEVADDEALDVTHLYIATEPLGEAPRPIEQHYERFQKRIDRSVPAAMEAPLAEARQKLEAAAETLKDLPLKINDAIARGLGQAPRPVRTTAEVVAEAVKVIDQQTTAIREGEKQLLATKAGFGHLVKIDTGGFAKAIEALAKAKTDLLTIPAKAEKALAEKAAFAKQMKQRIEKALGKVDPLLLQQKGIDAQRCLDALDEGPTNIWHAQGMRLVEQCRNRLQSDPALCAALAGLGLRRYTLTRAWLGISREPTVHKRPDWGLGPDEKGGGNPEDFVIPAGLVIPRFDGATLDKILVRSLGQESEPGDTSRLKALVLSNARDSVVAGSKETALCLGPAENKPFIRVADELEALLLHQEIGDMAAVIAMRDPGAKPDKDAADFLGKAPQFLVTVGSQAAADRQIEAWRGVHPQAEPLALPMGNNLFEARQQGLDIWQWVADALRPDLQPCPETKPKDVDPAEPGALAQLIPVMDVAAMVKKVRATLMGRIQPKLDKLEADKKKGLDIIRQKLAEQNVDLDEVLKKPGPDIMNQPNPFAAAKEKYAKQFAEVKDQLKKRHLFTPEVQQKLAEMEQANQDVLSQSAQRYEQGMAKLEAVKAQAKAGAPEWAKKLMSGAGIDPEDPAPARPLTRAEVVERHKNGQSLAAKNLAGLDLSGLDLRGIDLNRANLQKAKLAGCVLDGANLTQALAGEADFSKASLKEAKMTRGVFQKAKFTAAVLTQADLGQAVMSEADLTAADLTRARLEKTLLEKTVLAKAVLAQAAAAQAYFLSSNAAGANFAGANLSKAVFLKANIDQATFAGASIRGTAFIETAGDKVNFAGADMHNARILNGSRLRQGNFANAKADTSCWMKSDLAGGDFQGCSLERSLVEQCDLTGANLSGANGSRARLTKSDLSDADMEKINLFQGSLRKSKLVRAKLDRANLYGAEFYRTGVGDTRFEGANLKKTKLDKRLHLLPEMKKER